MDCSSNFMVSNKEHGKSLRVKGDKLICRQKDVNLFKLHDFGWWFVVVLYPAHPHGFMAKQEMGVFTLSNGYSFIVFPA